MSQGPLPMAWAQLLATSRGLWGEALRAEMLKYNHMAGFVPVGETEPRAANRVDLADETDQYGLRIPRVTFGYSDNDRKLQAHAVAFMSRCSRRPAGAISGPATIPAISSGTCRMGADPADQRRRPRWPQLGHPEPVDLRRLAVPDLRRGESVADDPGSGLPHGRPDHRHGPSGRARPSGACRSRLNRTGVSSPACQDRGRRSWAPPAARGRGRSPRAGCRWRRAAPAFPPAATP